jgi:hypothetical protein
MHCFPVQAKHAKGGGQKNIVLVDGVRTPFLLSGTSYKVISFLHQLFPRVQIRITLVWIRIPIFHVIAYPDPAPHQSDASRDHP